MATEGRMTNTGAENMEVTERKAGWEVTEHKDGRGRTVRYPCGCVLKHRGRSVRHSLCFAHGRELTESWLASVATPSQP